MTDLIRQLALEIVKMSGPNGLQMKDATGTPGTPFLHGPGGLFGVAGLERDVISSHVNAEGLVSMLPIAPSVLTHPEFAYITGFQDATGTQPDPDTDPCGAFPIAGSIKNCIQTARFGRAGFETREIDLNRLGEMINRGESMDLRVVNSPLVSVFANTLFGGFPQNQSNILAQDFIERLIEVGVAFQRHYGEQVYTGTGTNDEFPGLEVLVGTNKVDTRTGTDCPSLDSDVKDFNYSCIGDTNAANDLVRVLTTMWRFVNWNRTSMNFGGVDWRFAINPNLFSEIADVWPCSYNTYRCQSGFEAENARVFVDGNEQRRMSDEMRNGSYLIIDGVRVPVIQDAFIPEQSSATPGANLVDGQFASDILLLPFTVRGGTPVLFLEHFNYNNPQLQAALAGGRLLQDDFWTDNGRFLWHKQKTTGTCVVWDSQSRLRIVLRTPHLAGRLQNVCYEPLQHFRDPVPDDYYFVDGGVSTSRAAPSLYSDWNLP